jgi:hypothetical protein
MLTIRIPRTEAHEKVWPKIEAAANCVESDAGVVCQIPGEALMAIMIAKFQGEVGNDAKRAKAQARKERVVN